MADEDGVVLEIADEAQLEGAGDVDRSLRNRFWQCGPWHFGKSLIVLEKPVGSGDISKLGFNKVEFWIQIHNIPIMCMNRRTVQIDTSKPLKRWLRLKMGKSDEIVVVGLKYERLSDFCYACGRIGHVIKECIDEEAKMELLMELLQSSAQSSGNRENVAKGPGTN
ncbi:hypothetical protein EZV62_024685 [Acer yangbiense]|uniref:CCHC-type domain-containing protein n=1 Tax=Acer yangbiense TaxID=1000413 RepID=A0A5C7GVW8_9ROSI|nr:hypothetical protein EZV62_024685 [Acer yangbiense]